MTAAGSAGPDGGVAVLLHSVPGLLEHPHHERLLHQPLSGHVLLHGGPAVSNRYQDMCCFMEALQ